MAGPQLEEEDMKVKEVMHKGVTCVEPETTVTNIARRMRQEDIGAIPVKANGSLVGIVTDRDIACRAFGDSGDISRKTARDVMSQNVVCCTEDDDVDKAIALMEEKHIRRLPVTDGRKAPIGMLSLGDISHSVGKNLSGEVLRAVSAHHA
jgi:CBS domain-containing protein